MFGLELLKLKNLFWWHPNPNTAASRAQLNQLQKEQTPAESEKSLPTSEATIKKAL